MTASIYFHFLLVLTILFSAGCSQGSSENPTEAPSGSPPVNFRAGVDTATVKVGDIFHLELDVNHREGIDLSLQSIGHEISDFDILSIDETPQYQEKSRIFQSKKFKLQSRLSGTYQIPPLRLEYRDAVGEIASITSSPIWITVESHTPLASDTGDIRDLKPLRSHGNWPVIPRWLAVTLAILIFGAFIVNRLWRQTRVDVIPVMPEHEVALETLSRMDAAAAWKSGMSTPFSFELSQVYREYLAARYGIDVMEMTTEEIRDSGLPSLAKAEFEPMAAIFRFQDRVKFAKFVPPLEDFCRIFEEVRGSIQRTARETVTVIDEELLEEEA